MVGDRKGPAESYALGNDGVGTVGNGGEGGLGRGGGQEGEVRKGTVGRLNGYRERVGQGGRW